MQPQLKSNYRGFNSIQAYKKSLIIKKCGWYYVERWGAKMIEFIWAYIMDYTYDKYVYR